MDTTSKDHRKDTIVRIPESLTDRLDKQRGKRLPILTRAGVTRVALEEYLRRAESDQPSDAEMLDWLSKNEIIQQEVGSHGWRLPERTFREAICVAMQERP